MFDGASIDVKADPCTDFYKFACGNFAANHPIPGDQSGVDEFYLIYNVNTERLNNILDKYKAADPSRNPNQQKIGDFYAACMNTGLINQKGLAPIQPLLTEIDKVTKPSLPRLTGELQRLGVNAFFGFGEQQDFNDATKQIAVVDRAVSAFPSATTTPAPATRISSSARSMLSTPPTCSPSPAKPRSRPSSMPRTSSPSRPGSLKLP
jgi:putative endopeptidase